MPDHRRRSSRPRSGKRLRRERMAKAREAVRAVGQAECACVDLEAVAVEQPLTEYASTEAPESVDPGALYLLIGRVRRD